MRELYVLALSFPFPVYNIVMRIKKLDQSLVKLTFTDQVIEWIIKYCQLISANDFDGYAIDACLLYSTYQQGYIRVFYDICGNISVIANPEKYKKPYKKARKFFNKMITDGLLTLYDDPNEPFEEFSLRHNIPINNKEAILLDQNILTKSSIWEENIDNGKEAC